MQHFIGTYECKADAKGRIMLPAALKNNFRTILIKVLLSKGSFQYLFGTVSFGSMG